MANSSGDKHSCEGTMVQFPCPKNGGLPTWHNPKTVKVMRLARFINRVSDFFFGAPGPHDWMI